jgi:hypothetical protein
VKSVRPDGREVPGHHRFGEKADDSHLAAALRARQVQTRSSLQAEIRHLGCSNGWRLRRLKATPLIAIGDGTKVCSVASSVI